MPELMWKVRAWERAQQSRGLFTLPARIVLLFQFSSFFPFLNSLPFTLLPKAPGNVQNLSMDVTSVPVCSACIFQIIVKALAYNT